MAVESDVVDSPADFGSRFSAFMIDALILFGAEWIVLFVLSRQLQAVGLSSADNCSADPTLLCEGPSTAAWVILLALMLAMTIGYHAVFEGLRGATPGKFWMGLTVRGADGSSPIGLARGATRSGVRQLFWLSLLLVLDVSPISLGVGPALFLVIPAIPLVGLLVAAVAPSGRGIHDLAASTVVVHADGRTTAVRPFQPSTEDSP